MTLLGLRFWSPVSVVASLGTTAFGIAPLVIGGVALGSKLLGGLFGHKKAKQQEDADYQAQIDRNNAIMQKARGDMGRSRFLGSIAKAYGMDKLFGADYFSDQNIMNRALDRYGYSQPVRHSAGGPGWMETLAGAGLAGAGAYFGAKDAQEKGKSFNPFAGGGGGGAPSWTPNTGHVFDAAGSGGGGGGAFGDYYAKTYGPDDEDNG